MPQNPGWPPEARKRLFVGRRALFFLCPSTRGPDSVLQFSRKRGILLAVGLPGVGMRVTANGQEVDVARLLTEVRNGSGA